MPKLKTRKAALKRYKKTGGGNFLRRHAYKGHLLMKKSNVQNEDFHKDYVSRQAIVNLLN